MLARTQLPPSTETTHARNIVVYRSAVEAFHNAPIDQSIDQSRELLLQVIKDHAPYSNGHTNGVTLHLPHNYYPHRRRKRKTDPKPTPFDGPKRWGNADRPLAESTSIVSLKPHELSDLMAAYYAEELLQALVSDCAQESELNRQQNTAENMMVAANIEDDDWRGDSLPSDI